MLARLCSAEPLFGDFGYAIVTTFTAEQVTGDLLCVTEGPDGVLYFGGNSLVTYDGDRWTSTVVPGVQWIKDMDLAPDGRLWIAAHGEIGWFERQPNAEFRFHSLRPHLPDPNAISGQTHHILAVENGAVFVGGGRVHMWNGESMQSWTIPGTISPRLFRVNGEIWAQNYGTKVYRISSNGPEVVPNFDIGTNEEAVLLWVAANARAWVYGTKDSMFIRENGITRRIDERTRHLLREGIVSSASRLSDGRFAFCTGQQGVVVTHADGTFDQHLRENDGIAPYVLATLTDHEGVFWTVSSQGVHRINLSSRTRIFDQRAGIPLRPLNALAAGKGTVAVANLQNVLLLDAEKKNFKPLKEGGAVVESLANSASGLLITARRGISRYSSAGVQPLAKVGGDIRNVMPSRVHLDETLIADWSPAIGVVSAGDGTQSPRLLVRVPVVASSMAEDNDENLWIGTETRGVYVAARNSIEVVSAQRPSADFGLPEINELSHVRHTPAGDVIVITDKAAWLKRAGQKVFARVQNFPARPIAAVSPSMEDGTVWLAHSATPSVAACVARIITHGEARWVAHPIEDLDAIGPPFSICAETTDNGADVVWIGGSKAVLRHVVDYGKFTSRPAPPLVRKYIRNGDAQRQPLTGIIPYSTPIIEFEFASLQHRRRAQLRFESRIEGIDSNWVPVNRDGTRELIGLRDGSYRLQVRTNDETGATSEPAVFPFVVAPPWWRTPTAIALYILNVVLLVFGVHLIRVRALRRRNVLLEDKVRERTHELAEASAAKTLFVANMSHDIRNPLNGIVGLALALEDSRLDTEQREIVSTLRECTTYLSSLVDDVLDFASIEAGRIELRPGPFVPSELLNSVVTTLKPHASENGAFITIETDPEVPPMLHGDAGRIQQVLVNYLSNALKYAGGHIRLAACVRENSPGEVEFSVTDDGAGISAAEQATLFTKFSRLDGARRSHVPGTGLGLASCRLLADIMGGSVGVESRVGSGSRFFLRLPLAIAIEPAPASVDVSLPNATVLLVEDTDYNAMAATAVLRRLGLNCERASTGEDAIRMFGEKRHNIVLLDRNLPDLDGAEVARRMRELETDGLRAVLLAVTAYSSVDDRALCLNAGMDAFVGKPLTPEKLRRVLLAVGQHLLAAATMNAGSEPQPLPVDTSLLEYLAEGSEGGVAAQAERFVAALHEAHRDVVSAHAQKASATDLGNAAHRVLGQARMVGATGLSTAALELESAARKEDIEGVARAMPVVTSEVANLTAALRHPARAQKV